MRIEVTYRDGLPSHLRMDAESTSEMETLQRVLDIQLRREPSPMSSRLARALRSVLSHLTGWGPADSFIIEANEALKAAGEEPVAGG